MANSHDFNKPVAWMAPNGMVSHERIGHFKIPLYTAPPQREWQGLTDEEQGQVAWSCGSMSADWMEFARAIEAKLKEKNT